MLSNATEIRLSYQFLSGMHPLCADLLYFFNNSVKRFPVRSRDLHIWKRLDCKMMSACFVSKYKQNRTHFENIMASKTSAHIVVYSMLKFTMFFRSATLIELRKPLCESNNFMCFEHLNPG